MADPQRRRRARAAPRSDRCVSEHHAGCLALRSTAPGSSMASDHSRRSCPEPDSSAELGPGLPRADASESLASTCGGLRPFPRGYALPATLRGRTPLCHPPAAKSRRHRAPAFQSSIRSARARATRVVLGVEVDARGKLCRAAGVEKETQESSRVGVTRVAQGATQGLVKSYPMAAPAFSIQSQNAALLSDPALREGLLKFARRRLPPAEVEDLVQNTLTEALSAASPPSDPAEFRRWVHGIARHKIADNFRRRGRQPIPSADVDQNAAEPNPSLAELDQWIESELPKTDHARATLHWLLREGDGETLDEIARDVELPAPRVRQRVSRLRRHLHARWLALGAAGLMSLLVMGTLLYRAMQPGVAPPSIVREAFSPLERARALRQEALERCAAGAYPECIAALDRARALDPNGENARAIGEARAAAESNLQPRPIPERPALSPSGSVPDTKSTPKSPAPSKRAPKPFAPSKPTPKAEPFGALQQQNALPNQAILRGYDDLTGSAPASKKSESKKY